MTKLIWHNEKRKVKDMVPYKLNPRILSEFHARKLKESLKKFNLVEIPAIDIDNKILAGHQRIQTLALLGRGDEEIDVRVPSRKLTDEEFKTYNLTSNISAGEWNYELLKELNPSLLLNAGFDDITLSNIWDLQLNVDDDDFDVDKEIAKIHTPKTKPGDLIYFDNGWHRLICSDSGDPAVVAKLVQGCKINMINFDPIYNINLDYDKGFGTKGKYGGKVTDKKSEVEYKQFLKKIFQNALAHILPDCHVFCWCDETHIGLIQNLYTELDIRNRRICLWVKNSQNPTPQIAFNKAYEACAYGTIGNPYLSPNVKNLNEILNKELGAGNRLPEDIIDLFNIWLVKRLAGQDYEHPTQKPPTLYEKALRRCSKAGDIILDLFAGSGSLMCSAEQLKRRVFMSEISPVFCDLIVARYKHLTGKEVTYVS